jgi:hypothetical protein
MINAFAIPLTERGVDSLRTLVFVTTGALNELMRPRRAAETEAQELERVQEGLSNTLGFIGHELGHGITAFEKRNWLAEKEPGLDRRSSYTLAFEAILRSMFVLLLCARSSRTNDTSVESMPNPPR